MADQWYYTQNDERQGPVTPEELKELANSGQLKPDDLIWKKGMKDWIEAAKLSGLIPSELADAPPPLPKSVPAVHVAPSPVVAVPQQAADPLDFLSASSTAQSAAEPPVRQPAETAPAPADESFDVASLATSATRAFTEPAQAKFKKKAKGMFDSLAATGKAAGQLIAKQTERTKLLKVSLPSAYQELGRHVYNADLHRTEFAEQYPPIDTLVAEKQALEAQPKGAGMADKAKAAARAAQVQTVKMRINHALATLGEAVYEQHGEQSGPEELIRPIANHRSRLATLNADIRLLSQAQKGQLLTPKRLAIGAVAAASLLVLLMVYWAGSAVVGGRSGGGFFGGGGTVGGSGRDYKEGYQQGEYEAEEMASKFNSTNYAPMKKLMREQVNQIADEHLKAYKECVEKFGPGDPSTQRVGGRHDGFRTTLSKAGVL